MDFMSDARQGASFVRSVASIFTALGSVGAARRAAAEYERLAALSDGQLAALGLTREGLAEEVIKRHF